MRWQLQYARSLALAALPLQSRLRALKRSLTGIDGDPVNEPGCIDDGLRLIEMIGRDRIAGANVLELGSGWQPIIPLMFKEAGAGNVTMTDVRPLMDADYFDRAKATLADNGHFVEVSWQDFQYLAPCNWAAIPANSVDVIWSRAVLEHIAPSIIAALFGEFRRILKAGGVLAHIIDNSDHWEHKDKTISRVNFLKFNETAWRAINCHPLFYQNRLRHSDYRLLIQDAGFKVVTEAGDVCPASLAALQLLRLADHFSGRDKSDLATITSRFVAVPSPNN